MYFVVFDDVVGVVVIEDDDYVVYFINVGVVVMISVFGECFILIFFGGFYVVVWGILFSVFFVFGVVVFVFVKFLGEMELSEVFGVVEVVVWFIEIE